jgi:hypothetical protein
MKKYYKQGEDFICVNESEKSYTTINVSEYSCVIINITFEAEFNNAIRRLSDDDLSTEAEYLQKKSEALSILSL